MAIYAVCECGKKFQAKDEYEGRRGICPACRREFIFQAGGMPVFEEVPQELPPPLPVVVDKDDDHFEPEPAPKLEPSRPFWKDPIVVIGSIIPVTILSAFSIYLYFEHRHVHELKMRAVPPQTVKPIAPKLIVGALGRIKPNQRWTVEFRTNVKTMYRHATKSLDDGVDKAEMPEDERVWRRALIRDAMAYLNGITTAELQEILESTD